MKLNCNICNRKLEVITDPLSADCGGDCWGCIGEIEAEGGYEPSLIQVRKEFSDGLRQDWLPSPETSYEVDSESRVRIKVKLNKPLGAPWKNERFILRVVTKTSEINEDVILYTNELGEAIFNSQALRSINRSNFWYQIIRKENEWGYPIKVMN